MLEQKQQSKQLIEAGGGVLKKAKCVPSAEKIMVHVFWDAHDLVLIDHQEKAKQSTGFYATCSSS